MPCFRTVVACCLALLALTTLAPSPARADEDDRLYDFTDAYYKVNGVDPTKISGRRQADGIRAVTDVPNFRFQRNVRVLATNAAYNHSGDIEYFAVLGGGGTSLFTNDAAGRRARKIADSYIEYVFPSRGTNPVGLGASRQSVLLDMRNGYFSNNPLGLWLHVWVNYTDDAFGTARGRAALAELAERNGVALDGTPIIATVGEIEDLFEMGLVTLDTRPGTDPLRYAICPVIKDPADGGIAPDQTLNYPKLPNGDPLEPQFLRNFLSLQKTGDWAD
jgi:hypothetical protein